MQIKIYVDEAPIYITDELSAELKNLSTQKDVLLLKDKNIQASVILSTVKNNKKKAVIILGENFRQLQNEFFNQFKIIEASGGIVQNEEKELLFIFRRNKWDLPKGKMETGETAETCAAREIEEETGVNNLHLKHKIGETFHIYEERGDTILKVSHWFYFVSEGTQNTVPQTEEDIAEVKWIHTKDIKKPMANTYQNIKDILTIFFDTP